MLFSGVEDYSLFENNLVFLDDSGEGEESRGRVDSAAKTEVGFGYPSAGLPWTGGVPMDAPGNSSVLSYSSMSTEGSAFGGAPFYDVDLFSTSGTRGVMMTRTSSLDNGPAQPMEPSVAALLTPNVDPLMSYSACAGLASLPPASETERVSPLSFPTALKLEDPLHVVPAAENTVKPKAPPALETAASSAVSSRSSSGGSFGQTYRYVSEGDEYAEADAEADADDDDDDDDGGYGSGSQGRVPRQRRCSRRSTSLPTVISTAKKVSDSRLSAQGLAEVLKLGSAEEALRRERFVLDILENDLHYPLGYKTWVRDTSKDYRNQLLDQLHKRVKVKYPEYDKPVLETIIRRATYYMMQSRLRRERRAKAKAKRDSVYNFKADTKERFNSVSSSASGPPTSPNVLRSTANISPNRSGSIGESSSFMLCEPACRTRKNTFTN
ncbi:AER181Cp [Eremothecium gossypii ATCC 10895]|uniref:AER181Cp n=1 Tax=Eremothecium gossypii (strain ATCC 10895 / CBS 109.51 / FGSC 9923 / NRRL Y-1056) TaxID=284811 RepID=Q756S3_EREGS|nr:AER181Cp [Eremothecium gossypii ATCC 10895]AAS52862.1 AER181Cp [Eremothecium gossypii ATCC 10895]AEY97169.1 FAER181Cp [Eremothecium gossypii FDAG1]